MRYKPERALTHIDIFFGQAYYFVEMRYKPERALTQIRYKYITIVFDFCRNEV